MQDRVLRPKDIGTPISPCVPIRFVHPLSWRETPGDVESLRPRKLAPGQALPGVSDPLSLLDWPGLGRQICPVQLCPAEHFSQTSTRAHRPRSFFQSITAPIEPNSSLTPFQIRRCALRNLPTRSFVTHAPNCECLAGAPLRTHWPLPSPTMAHTSIQPTVRMLSAAPRQ